MSNLENSTNFDPMQGHNAQNVKAVVTGVSQGILPNNATLAHVLDKVTSSHHVDSITSDLSGTGRTVLRDIQQLATTTKETILQKNEGDHLQQAIAHAAVAAQKIKSAHLDSDVAGLESVKQGLSDSLEKMISVSKLILSSKDFRTELQGFWSIVMDIVTYNTGIKDPLVAAKGVVVESTEAGIRSSAHARIDTIADFVDGVVPQHVQNKISDSVQPHIQSVVEGDLPPVIALHNAGLDLYKTSKEKVSHMEIPPEKRDALIAKMKQNVLDIQKNPQVQRGISDLVDIFYGLIESAQVVKDDIKQKAKVVVNSADEEANLALGHLKAVLENFANKKSLDPIISGFRDFATKLSGDLQVKAYLADWKYFIKKSISDVNFVDREQYPQDAKRLTQHGNDLLYKKYADDVTSIGNELSAFIAGFSQDTLNKRVGTDVNTLVQDLFFDSNGNPVIKPELFSDFGKLLPLLSEKIAYIPIPHIEIEDADYKVVLDNIVVRCDGVLPNYVNLRASATVDTTTSQLCSTGSLTVSHIQASAQNIRFYIKKKKGIRMSDSGYLDFDLYGRGVSATVELVPFVNATEKGIHLKECLVSLDKLKIKLHDTRRDFLYKIFSPLVNKIAKERIAKAITEQLRKVIIGAEMSSPVQGISSHLGKGVDEEHGHHHLSSHHHHHHNHPVHSVQPDVEPVNPSTGYPSYILPSSIVSSALPVHDHPFI